MVYDATGGVFLLRGRGLYLRLVCAGCCGNIGDLRDIGCFTLFVSACCFSVAVTVFSIGCCLTVVFPYLSQM